MLGHPAFLPTLIGSNAESKTLFAEKYVSAISRVDAPDGVVFGKLYYISAFGINVSLGEGE